VYQNPLRVTLRNVVNGTYDAYVTVWENDFPERYDLQLQGQTVAAARESGSAGTWARLGPFRVTVADGTFSLVSVGWLSNLSGVELVPAAARR
jgi:hypothetical protein